MRGYFFWAVDPFWVSITMPQDGDIQVVDTVIYIYNGADQRWVPVIPDVKFSAYLLALILVLALGIMFV